MPPPATPPPQAKTLLYSFLGIAALTFLFGIVALFKSPVSNPKNAPPLLVFCAASLKTPVEIIAADYRRATGTRVELSLGGSQTLLANLQITRRGDLYLPADDSYLDLAREKKLVAQTFPLARQTAVIAVARGNPKQVRRLSDCTNSSISLAQASPETAAVGKLLRAATERTGLWLALSNRTLVFKPTVVDAANDVKLGAVDAAFVWDSMQKQYADLEFIRAPELAAVEARVAVSVLTCSAQPEAALKFARYLAARETGLKHFQESGFNISASPP